MSTTDFEALTAETLSICQNLIRIDTTNTGDDGSVGERAAAEYVMGLLQEVGYQPDYFESRPRRGTILLRIEGRDQSRPPLVVHGHLDVVPADLSGWSVDPFGGEIRDGYLWGRGAVDMKDMDAMILAVLRDWARTGHKPPRDLLVCFFADEEAGGRLGSHWTVDHHPDFFQGAQEAITEVGGYSVEVAGRRTYLIQTAEKGIAWLRLTAKGTPGHGSAINHNNAVASLVEALSRINAHIWPVRLTPTMRAMMEGAAELTGLNVDLNDRASLDRLLEAFGPARRLIEASVSTNANLTSLAAGGKINVVPGQASAGIDIRPLPGDRDLVFSTVRELAGPNVSVEAVNDDVAIEFPFDTPLVAAMRQALSKADPGSAVLPYMLPAGTDSKALSRLGIKGYGFTPLRLPAGFDFTAMFHGNDERVPVASLAFGTTVLADFLEHC